jgi:hypothetical protein
MVECAWDEGEGGAGVGMVCREMDSGDDDEALKFISHIHYLRFDDCLLSPRTSSLVALGMPSNP